MRVTLYLDLPEPKKTGFYQDVNLLCAVADPITEPMDGVIRYAIEVDLPTYHFKSSADRKVKVLSVSKLEE